jgi:transposase
MKVLYERVAGIDVHKDMIKVAIRSPGDKPWTRKTEILEYRTFYGVLQHMAIELVRRGVTHVVMEASGVYTEPVYYALAEHSFTEIAVINPAHAKALKGHKTDAKDCARLAELFECGLLRGSYIPAPELKEVRDLTRYRTKTVQARTSEIQRLGKSLESAGFSELCKPSCKVGMSHQVKAAACKFRAAAADAKRSAARRSWVGG